MKSLRLATLLTAVFILGGVQANAATLFGQVIEVTEGDTLKVLNMKRQVKIRLIGVDAPEKNQEFGDLARQHLSDLVFGKNVVVEYRGMGRDGTIIGRVLLNDADMNAQMLRDGAAWFDASSRVELGEEKSEIYFESEKAARTEKRGLWQSDSAIAPWEFVKNDGNKRPVVVRVVEPTNNAKPDRPRTELTSEGLINTSKGRSSQNDMSWATSSENKIWERLQPVGENFSALIPVGGKQTKEPILFGNNETIDVNVYVVREGTSIYALMWTTGPATYETDSDVIKSTLSGFLRGIGAGYESLGGQFSCAPGAGTDVSTGGFTGRSFKLAGCTVPAVARVFTKAADGKRRLYLGAVFYNYEDESVERFLQSFTVNGSAVSEAKPSRKRAK